MQDDWHFILGIGLHEYTCTAVPTLRFLSILYTGFDRSMKSYCIGFPDCNDPPVTIDGRYVRSLMTSKATNYSIVDSLRLRNAERIIEMSGGPTVYLKVKVKV